ncbi:MAG TPA: trypsin-like peptidase domain-containing protein [Candidatus Saccharimonadales bacterium]
MADELDKEKETVESPSVVMPSDTIADEDRKSVDEPSHHDDLPKMPSTFHSMHKEPKKLPANHPKMRFLFVAFALILSAGAGFGGGWLGGRDNNNATVEQQKVVLQSQSQLISNIAQNVGQSVVSVVSTQSGGTSSTGLFGLDQSSGASEEAGSGIILTSDGLIITNRHVVPAGTTSVSVTLADGTTYNNVTVVGRTNEDDSLDIAFLKIPNTNGHKLVAAQVGDSSKTKVGDSVVAIGNALGQYQNTVTSGIISGYGRSVQASDSTGSSTENLDDLFQTDAAINEGNSGGPLVNLDGQVIGINTAVASDAQSIGFAIPINDVAGLIKSVEQSGKLQQPYLGVIFVPITADVQSEYNLSVANGAWIAPEAVTGQAAIVSGGPAAAAGLKEGDIITAVNGTAVNQSTSLTSIIDKLSVGDKVTLTVVRSGKTVSVTATLGSAPTS